MVRLQRRRGGRGSRASIGAPFFLVACISQHQQQSFAAAAAAATSTNSLHGGSTCCCFASPPPGYEYATKSIRGRRRALHLHASPWAKTQQSDARSHARDDAERHPPPRTATLTPSKFLGKFGLVPRLTLAEYRSSPVYDRPVLITDLFRPSSAPPLDDDDDDGDDDEDVESLAGNLLGQLADANVALQRTVRPNSAAGADSSHDAPTTTELYDVTLREAVRYAMDSCHDDSVFSFCEGLLPTAVPAAAADRPREGEDASNDEGKQYYHLAALSRRLAQLRDKPFASTENWFDHFPSSARPTDAVILAGEGATSTLHRDPFEWTGTSLCLEGAKIWRFVLPPAARDGGVEAVDDALSSYRLNSIAWSGEEEEGDEYTDDEQQQQLTLSAGWQSDLTLYESRDDLVPSAEQLAELSKEDEVAYCDKLEGIATDPDLLAPCPGAALALDAIWSLNRSNTGDSGDECIDSECVVAAVQRAGELLVIPAHCWHQTYAPEPSIAVASQRCGADVDAGRVFRHVLETVGALDGEVPDILAREGYSEGDAKSAVRALFDFLSTHTNLEQKL